MADASLTIEKNQNIRYVAKDANRLFLTFHIIRIYIFCCFLMIKLFIFFFNKLISDTCLTETHSNLLLHCAATALSG